MCVVQSVNGPRISVAVGSLDWAYSNGIMKVTATDVMTGKNKSIVIKSSGGLSEGDVERMVQEAERMREADQKRAQAFIGSITDC